MNLSILQKSFNIDINSIDSTQIILGPCRVFPGRLSVSRSFGDIEAKLIKTGGNPNVVISTPEITCFKLTSEMDFIVLGCDGIFDQLSNKEIIDCISLTTREDIRANDVHLQCSLANDLIIKNCLNRKCLDNITCVIVGLENFEKLFESEILHTYDGNVPFKRISSTNRLVDDINLDNVEKFRSYSNRNNFVPTSTKNSRPKIPIFEENNNYNNNYNNNFNNNVKIKNSTPMSSQSIKERLVNIAAKRNLFSNEINGEKKHNEDLYNSIDKNIKENNNSNIDFKSKQIIDKEKNFSNTVKNLSNLQIKNKKIGGLKFLNNVKLNFDYKNQNKDNYPIPLTQVTKKNSNINN